MEPRAGLDPYNINIHLYVDVKWYLGGQEDGRTTVAEDRVARAECRCLPLTVFRKNGKSFQYVMGFLCETAVSSSVFYLNWGVNDHKT